MLPNCGCELNLASKQTWHSDFFCAIRNTTTNSSLAEKLLFVQPHNTASCYQSQPRPPPSHGQRSTRAVSSLIHFFFIKHPQRRTVCEYRSNFLQTPQITSGLLTSCLTRAYHSHCQEIRRYLAQRLSDAANNRLHPLPIFSYRT